MKNQTYDEFVQVLEDCLLRAPNSGVAMVFKLDESLVVPQGYNYDDDLEEMHMDQDKVHPEVRG